MQMVGSERFEGGVGKQLEIDPAAGKKRPEMKKDVFKQPSVRRNDTHG
jgi:hypothetical protein